MNEKIISGISGNVNNSRRHFIKQLSAGTAGLSLASLGITGCSSIINKAPSLNKSSATELGESRVSFIRGTDRREMVYEALKPFENEIKESIMGKQVVIKINCVVDSNPLIATHPDAVRAILDFLKPIYDRTIIIGESTASPKGTYVTFEQYGYVPLEKEYNVKLVELNSEPTTYYWILDQNMFPQQIRIINTFLDPNNYVISVTRLKTHNVAVATLTLKNVVMGSPLKIPKLKINDKSKMHANRGQNQSPKMLNVNLFLMAHRVHPDFGILDGLVGVEGDGPTRGDPVDHKVVLAGPDYLSVDRIGAELMGIPWEDIGYLSFCGDAGLGQSDLSKIKILGSDYRDYIIKYKLHSNIEWQYEWKDELVIPKKH